MSNYGIDCGSGQVKYDRGRLFASNIVAERTENPETENTHSVVYQGVSFTVGQPGKGHTFGDTRYKSTEYLIMLLTAIALRNKGVKTPIEANLVIGVPARLFNLKFTTDLQDHLKNRSHEFIEVDGNSYDISINDVKVMLEGCIPLYNNTQKKVMCIDIGDNTIDITIWLQGKKINSYTIDKGVYYLAKKLSKHLKENPEFQMKVTPEECYEYIGKDHVLCGGQYKPAPAFPFLLRQYANEIISDIASDEIDVKSIEEIYLIGGGANIVYDLFKENFPALQPLFEGVQFVNQQIYEKVAREIFKKEDKEK